MGLILAYDAESIPFDDVSLHISSWELSMVLGAQSDQVRAVLTAAKPRTYWLHGQLHSLSTCIHLVSDENLKLELNFHYFPRLVLPLGQLRFGKGLPHLEVRCYYAMCMPLDHEPMQNRPILLFTFNQMKTSTGQMSQFSSHFLFCC